MSTNRLLSSMIRKKLVFATNNANKLRELREIVGDSFDIVSLREIGCDEDIPETSETIRGNALQKARYVKEHYGVDCFADDTGLEVEALGGEPGVRTARYGSAEGHDSEANINRLLTNLRGVTDRRARFLTVIALILDGEEYVFEGICNGVITEERCGESGFGYDPVFRPEGSELTFAQMTPEAKNAVSHRGRATALLIDRLKQI